MKRSIYHIGVMLLVSSLISLKIFAEESSVEYDFIKPYVAAKNKLKKLPLKKIEKTLFCSNMHTMVDRAVSADRSQKNLRADRIVVSKTRRKLYLFSQRELISEYNVAFGFGSQDGAKSQRGDGRTPEGIYQIDAKKSRTNYRLALHISYPNERDEAFAKANNVDAGGSILIHGNPEIAVDGLDPVLIPQIHPRVDWTQGCIGLADKEIDEVYDYIEEGTTIEICPLDPTQAEAKVKTLENSSDVIRALKIDMNEAEVSLLNSVSQDSTSAVVFNP